MTEPETETETVPCKFCDEPTPYKGTQMCNGCWQVERNIRDFVRHWKGRRFLLNLLANSERPKP